MFFYQRSLFCVNHEMTHEYEPPHVFDDDSEFDKSSLSDKQYARPSAPSLASAVGNRRPGRLTKYALPAQTRMVFLQNTRRSASSDLASAQHRPKGTRHAGRRPKARRERHRSHRSNCKKKPWSSLLSLFLKERHLCFLAASALASTVLQINGRRCRRRPSYQRRPPPVQFCYAHERLGSHGKVDMITQGSEGVHGPCVAFLSVSKRGSLHDRTHGSFLVGGWCGRTLHAERRKP